MKGHAGLRNARSLTTTTCCMMYIMQHSQIGELLRAESLNSKVADQCKSFLQRSFLALPPWLPHTPYLEVKVALHDSKVNCGLGHEA